MKQCWNVRENKEWMDLVLPGVSFEVLWGITLLAICVLLTLWLAMGSASSPPKQPVLMFGAALLHPRHISLGVNEEGIEEFTLHSALHASAAPVLPPKRDLWQDAVVRKVPVLNQGQWGSCVGHAVSYAWQNAVLRSPNSNAASMWFLPSRCFLYAESRLILGDTDLAGDDGSTMHAGAAALSQRGVLPESQYPYSWTNISRAPPSSVRAAAASRRRATRKVRFTLSTSTNVTNFKAELAAGRLVMIGILVFASWMESSAAMSSGRIPFPRVQDQCVGGHAIALSGWDDASRVFTFRNSWGNRVGKSGAFSIPYDYVCNPNFAGDAWVVS